MQPDVRKRFSLRPKKSGRIFWSKEQVKEYERIFSKKPPHNLASEKAHEMLENFYIRKLDIERDNLEWTKGYYEIKLGEKIRFTAPEERKVLIEPQEREVKQEMDIIYKKIEKLKKERDEILKLFSK